MHAVHIKTHGLMCHDCTALVEESVSHMPGVKGVVSVQSMSLTSVLYDETLIDGWTIAESIRKIGFEVENPRSL